MTSDEAPIHQAGRTTQMGAVAHIIQAGQPVSRSELAIALEKGSATITKAVRPLLHEGLLAVTGTARTAGRPASMLRINNSALSVIGIELRPHRSLRRVKVDAVLVDLGGEIVDRQEDVAEGTSAPGEVAAAIRRAVVELCDRADGSGQVAPSWIGIELGGRIDPATGTVLFSPNMHWTEPVELAAMVESATHLPVVIDNDANALAEHERLFGEVRGPYRPDGWNGLSFASVILGDGVGAGIVLGNAVQRGATNRAGELGHIAVPNPWNDGFHKCRCGLWGCLETLVTTSHLRGRLRRGKTRPSMKSILGSDDAMHPKVQETLRNAGAAFGFGLVALQDLCDVEHVLVRHQGIGDSTSFRDGVVRTLTDHTYPKGSAINAPEYKPYKPELGARGAAAVALHAHIAHRFRERPSTESQRRTDDHSSTAVPGEPS